LNVIELLLFYFLAVVIYRRVQTHYIVEKINLGMKQLLFIIGVILIVAACSSQKRVVKKENNADIEITADSTEYGLETFDSKFKTWFQMHGTPANYRSLQYYEAWNRQYVSAWNQKARRGRTGSFFEPITGYDLNVDYDFELNHELFYYFQYVEQVLKIQIIPGGGPKAVIF
jgi:hypothetical protein